MKIIEQATIISVPNVTSRISIDVTPEEEKALRDFIEEYNEEKFKNELAREE